MKTYRITSTFKDKNGRTIIERVYQFQGENAKCAIIDAHREMAIEVEHDPRIDIVSTQAKCIEDGEVVQTSDYADELGRGISSTGLAQEIEMPDEATAEAEQRALQRDAVDAVLSDEQKRELVQESLAETDPIGDFFGGERPSERLKRAGGVPVGTDGFQGQAQGDGAAQPGGGSANHSGGPGTCDKTFESCRDKFNNAHRFPAGPRGKCPYVFGSRACGVRGATAESGAAAAPTGADGGAGQGGASAPVDPRDKAEGQRLLGQISEAAQRALQVHGRRAIGVNVNPTDAKHIAKALGLPPGATVNGGTYKGIVMSVDPGLQRCGPQIIMSDSSGTYKAPRAKGPGFAQGGLVNSGTNLGPGTVTVYGPQGNVLGKSKVDEFHVTPDVRQDIHPSVKAMNVGTGKAEVEGSITIELAPDVVAEEQIIQEAAGLLSEGVKRDIVERLKGILKPGK